MYVARLEVSDFRNYSAAAIDLAAGVTIVLGANGQGKTNLVEALGYLASGSSHRVSSDQALVRAGTDAAVVRALLRHGERSIVVECQINRSGSNKLLVNTAPVRGREAQRYIDSVLFAPEDLALIRGEPAGRRRMVDSLLTAMSPRMAGVLSDYDRVVRQRTTLLKTARSSRVPADSLGTLDIWDERLATLGAEIILGRRRLVGALRSRVEDGYQRIAGVEHRVDIAMRESIDHPERNAEDGGRAAIVDSANAPGTSPTSTVAGAPDVSGGASAELAESARSAEAEGIPPGGDPASRVAEPTAATATGEVADQLLGRIAEVRREELDRAVTLVGPHRDDLVITLNGLPARGYASHGESWSLALALRIASAELLRQTAVAGDPVVILDDVFAELDQARRSRLLDAVIGFEQVIVTAAVAEDVPGLDTSRVIRIHAGAVVDDDE